MYLDVSNIDGPLLRLLEHGSAIFTYEQKILILNVPS